MTNTKTAHTPGPWSYGQESIDPEWWIVTIKGGLIVANVNAHAHQEANARLIAAAPDLRDGCNALDGLLTLLLARDDLPPAVREVIETSHRREEARAAIAKAGVA